MEFLLHAAIAQPTQNEDGIEIVVPNSLQMDWCESPPFFCSRTETAQDIIQSLAAKSHLPAHKFEAIMIQEIPQPNPENLPPQCIHSFEVFVNNFICTAESSKRATLQHLSRAMLHGIHVIFSPPNITQYNGFDPISEVKQEKGEGTWSTEKEILAWDFNGVAGTICLPLKKYEKNRILVKDILWKSACTRKQHQQLAG